MTFHYLFEAHHCLPGFLSGYGAFSRQLSAKTRSYHIGLITVVGWNNSTNCYFQKADR
jgi:hypothetical protein